MQLTPGSVELIACYIYVLLLSAHIEKGKEKEMEREGGKRL